MKIVRLITCLAITIMLTCPCAFAESNPRAQGDIVARDLMIPGLGWAGHVGMFSNGKVLEILDNSSVIQFKSFDSFKRQSNYWGARYGRGKKHWKAINVGWHQRHFSPKYMYTPFYQAGGKSVKRIWNARKWRWEKKTVNKKAKFRCDTFVYYSFKKGIREKMAFNKYTITPIEVYFRMPHQR